MLAVTVPTDNNTDKVIPQEAEVFRSLLLAVHWLGRTLIELAKAGELSDLSTVTKTGPKDAFKRARHNARASTNVCKCMLTSSFVVCDVDVCQPGGQR